MYVLYLTTVPRAAIMWATRQCPSPSLEVKSTLVYLVLINGEWLTYLLIYSTNLYSIAEYVNGDRKYPPRQCINSVL